MPISSSTMALKRISDALADSALELSDEEILEETPNPKETAAAVKAALLKGLESTNRR